MEGRGLSRMWTKVNNGGCNGIRYDTIRYINMRSKADEMASLI